jgi:hypothetical protein
LLSSAATLEHFHIKLFHIFDATATRSDAAYAKREGRSPDSASFADNFFNSAGRNDFGPSPATQSAIQFSFQRSGKRIQGTL